MSSELVTVPRRVYRKEIPALHRASLDTRIQWLWNQKFGTVQMIWKDSEDTLDHTAATLLLQAIMAKDLESISIVFQRIEGAPIDDDILLDRVSAEGMRI